MRNKEINIFNVCRLCKKNPSMQKGVCYICQIKQKREENQNETREKIQEM